VSAQRTVPPRRWVPEKSAHDELDSDDDLVRAWLDELREAEEKMEAYESEVSIARTFEADVRHTQTVLATLPQRIAARRAEVAEERWAKETFGGLQEIPVASMDRSFASVKKGDLSRIAPDLAAAIPKKSQLWADWSVWNFRRRSLRRASKLPAEAVRRAHGSLAQFERLEVWQTVGMTDPWLVGRVRLPSGRERFYLIYDWGLETTAERRALR
jgi:hypothetical protein